MGYIYLLESNIDYEQYHKIGFTKNKDIYCNRLPNIGTGNPGEIKVLYLFETKHNRKVETSLHYYFGSKRGKGEWFKLEITDINNFIKICEKLETNFDILKENENPFY